MSNVISTNFIGKLFGSYKAINLQEDSVLITKKNGDELLISFAELADFPKVSLNPFGAKLCFDIDTETHTFRFLNKAETKTAHKKLLDKSSGILGARVNTALSFFHKHCIERYLRDSKIEEAESTLKSVLDKYSSSENVWKIHLDKKTIDSLDGASSLLPLEEQKNRLRESYEARNLKHRSVFFDQIESNPLTQQQRLAVLRDNDRNLVLAAAGTGKTSVMVAKALNLIDSGAADNDDILILAYNNAAAKELKERVMLRGEPFGITEESIPTISTFHALGKRILREAGHKTYLSEFTEDPLKLEAWVNRWIVDYIQSSPRAMRNFIELAYQPISAFDFETKAEYDAYIRDNEYRTLQNERVKGYQELVIANWLFMNGIEYKYEAPYVSKRRIEIGFDYSPDFHFTGTNIYLEHFGIDRQGNTRVDIDKEKYNLDIKRKRALHDECGTQLIETYHYDWVEGELENRLSELIRSVGLEIKPKSFEEMFKALQEAGFISEAGKRYLKCLQAIRVERLDSSSTLLRLEQNKIVHAKKYTELLDDMHTAYVTELREQDRIDFDDMILSAIDAVSSGSFTPKWKHILVDEFQDISMARMDFLKALISRGPNPTFTAVGDDWQSIYRFSGGKLELTTRFEELVGSHCLTKLEKTFRYNNSIAETAGTFVMENPEQYKKSVITHHNVDTPQVYLLDNDTSIEERVAQVISAIRKNDTSGSIAVLARYRYLLTNTREALAAQRTTHNIKYWTFHGSKGLEADYCILIGFFQGKTGFPNMNKEEAVVEALLPSLDSFPHSEERRLLYVALTRAKNKSYLIADPMATSAFINELLTPKYNLHIASKAFEERYRKIFKCPQCTDGYLRLLKGEFGEFYRCTSGHSCTIRPRVCSSCRSPSIDQQDKSVCNNVSCANTMPICNICGRPMRLRQSKYGEFLGCSGYGIKEDQCKNTRRIV